MKRIFTLLVLIVFVHSISRAQMKQGSILIGGDFALGTAKGQLANSIDGLPAKSSFVAVDPVVAIALKDNFYAGVAVNYSYFKASTLPAPGDTKQTASEVLYGGNFFLREYKPVIKKCWFFLEEGIGASGGEVKGDSTFHLLALGLGASVGASYQVTPRLQLETGLRNLLSISYQSISDSEHSKAFTLSTALTQPSDYLYLGFRFILGNP